MEKRTKKLFERLDEFIGRANSAYYASADPYRDFTTAPEISQVFGELLGGWVAAMWRGGPVLLVETGPGRGTLMADMLRTIERVAPGLREALSVWFVEASPRLRALQAVRVPGALFAASLDEIPGAPLILVANEFVDALPIRQFLRRDGAWAERYVLEGRFVERPAPPVGLAGEDGDVVEIGQAAQDWAACLGGRLARDGGAALVLDYGYAAAGPGDTLQALRGGRFADPLADPGSADLTAHVDFGAVARAASAAGAAVFGPIGQGDFLERLGLSARTGRLADANPARAAALPEAADRLASPARMGTLFKVLAMAAPGGPVPPGFA